MAWREADTSSAFSSSLLPPPSSLPFVSFFSQSSFCSSYAPLTGDTGSHGLAVNTINLLEAPPVSPNKPACSNSDIRFSFTALTHPHSPSSWPLFLGCQPHALHIDRATRIQWRTKAQAWQKKRQYRGAFPSCPLLERLLTSGQPGTYRPAAILQNETFLLAGSEHLRSFFAVRLKSSSELRRCATPPPIARSQQWLTGIRRIPPSLLRIRGCPPRLKPSSPAGPLSERNGD